MTRLEQRSGFSPDPHQHLKIDHPMKKFSAKMAKCLQSSKPARQWNYFRRNFLHCVQKRASEKIFRNFFTVEFLPKSSPSLRLEFKILSFLQDVQNDSELQDWVCDVGVNGLDWQDSSSQRFPQKVDCLEQLVRKFSPYSHSLSHNDHITQFACCRASSSVAQQNPTLAWYSFERCHSRFSCHFYLSLS